MYHWQAVFFSHYCKELDRENFFIIGPFDTELDAHKGLYEKLCEKKLIDPTDSSLHNIEFICCYICESLLDALLDDYFTFKIVKVFSDLPYDE